MWARPRRTDFLLTSEWWRCVEMCRDFDGDDGVSMWSVGVECRRELSR